MLLNIPLLFPLIMFGIVMSFTPGLNNIMLMTTGLNFGLRRTVPTILGVIFGFLFLVLCIGMGLGAVFTAYPIIYVILKYAGGIYLLYLAYSIAKSDPSAPPDAPKRKKPMGFFQAIIFQVINPKSWIMTISATATYASIAAYPYNILLIVMVFGIIGVGSTSTWAALGALLRRLMHRPKLLRTFNIVMALLLVASLYPIFADAIK